MTYPPPYGHQPPPPPKKKARKWPWVVGGVVLLFVIVGVSNGNDRSTTQNVPGVPSGTGGSSFNPTPRSVPGGMTQETWTQQGNRWVAPSDTAQPAAPAGTFADGTYEVNVDVQPGKYKTPGGDSCYWARLKNENNDFDSIISNDFSKGPMTVTIKSSDAYFQTNGCTWTKVA